MTYSLEVNEFKEIEQSPSIDYILMRESAH